MKINNLSEHNCIINRYLAEMRDCEYQKNRLLFRNNIKRIGEYEAFEISKTLNYQSKEVTTPLGVAQVNFPTDKIVIGIIGCTFNNDTGTNNRFTIIVEDFTRNFRKSLGVLLSSLNLQ